MLAKAGMILGLLALALLLLVRDSFHSGELELHSAMGHGVSSRKLVMEYADIAREAYLYSVPLLQSYRLLYQDMGQAGGGRVTARFNYLQQSREISADKSQWLETRAWLDLRGEPVLVHLPEGFSDRSRIKVSDLYGDAVTHWRGSESGGKGGNYLIASGSWQGEVPPGIERVIRSRSDLLRLLGRSQAVNATELERLRRWHNQLGLLPLSHFGESPSPPVQPPVVLTAWSDSLARSPGFIPYTNFILQFVHPPIGELEQLQRFQSIGIEAGLLQRPRHHSGAIAAGVEQALQALVATPTSKAAGQGSGLAESVATIRPI